MKYVLGILLAAIAMACSGDERSAEPTEPADREPAPIMRPRDARVPRNVAELFTTRILPTCSVNNGVCHNSKSYPDLRNLAAMRDLVDLPVVRTPGYREIVPGDPGSSYVVRRLWDTEIEPELMPRQCREWNDEATRSLGCWIEGLRPDLSNFDADIDYARCTFVVPQPGRCGSGLDLASVLGRRCIGCHGDVIEGNLDLRNASEVVDRASTQRPSMKLVTPFAPDESYLFLKLTADPPAIEGARMPKAGTLEQAELDVVRTWIADGAR